MSKRTSGRDPPTLVHIDNRYSSTLAMIGGAILTITRPILLRLLPAQVTNAWADLFRALSSNGQLTVFGVLAYIMSILVQFSGITIFIGGLLCHKNHLRSGKELVGLGTTVGLADLLLLVPSLASDILGPPLWVAWFGLACSVFADRHIHGPQASYAGEVRRLLGALRARLARKNVKKRLRKRRSRGIRARRVRPSTVEYEVGGNKKGEA